MKFLVVFAVVLISASVRAQDGLGNPPVTDQVYQNPPVEQAVFTEVPITVVPETQTVQAPAIQQTETIPVSTTTEAPLHTIGTDIWDLIVNVASGTENIPMGIVRMEISRLNRKLYNVFDYKLVLLSDCPVLMNEDLGTIGLTTAEKIAKGMSFEDAINDGILRLRKKILKKFGLMLVSKSYECQNPASS
ncbi:hypothetical protein QAD02_015160 [Eretmocerus hayati]|uniref:Uncharacterized protein n=1 Tax=Eretmocerus hayati TaxID=131215 RepID=A0ACC2P7H8_9HYME|nr:hypothetical protein QAD02_015160 [Eretmocerus hayati]